MSSKKEKGIHQLYGENSDEAEYLLWGEGTSRRRFLGKAAIAAMAAAVGGPVIFGDRFPRGLIPAALAQGNDEFVIPGKEGLTVLNDRPVNAETPAHLLDDDITPGKNLFIRNNGTPPAFESIDPNQWTLEIGGESAEKSVTYTLPELKEKFEHYTYQLTIECGGKRA